MPEKLLPMRTIRVHYDDGDSMITLIRATIPECARMYLDHMDIVEDFETGKERRRWCTRIEFLDRNYVLLKSSEAAKVIRSIYSLPEAEMKRNHWHDQLRYTADIYRDEDWMLHGDDARRLYSEEEAYNARENQFENIGYARYVNP